MGFFSRFKSKFERAIEERRGKESVKTVSETKTEPTSATVTAPPKTSSPQKQSGDAYRILSHALVSEKTASLATEGKYVFVVAPFATKLQVKRAVQEVYGILPTAVNMIRLRGKRVQFGQRAGKRKQWKKAIVEMPKGKTLPIYE
ncbi:50S ribosomal protein L23 [Candidatus Uhrbacteria bacterium]|nr:50S ribosomal protein L23 [Candidatus Uhrbacteria bacterium]